MPSAADVPVNTELPESPVDSASLGPTIPVSDAASANDNDESACFPHDSIVILSDGTERTMEYVRVGDVVQVGSGLFSPAFMLTHRDPHGMYDFISIHTSAKPLRLSAGHYLLLSGTLRTAGTAQVGDWVVRVEGTRAFTMKVENVRGRGQYNVQTVHGAVVADGVLASMYTSVVTPKVAHALLLPLRWISTALEAEVSLGALENGRVSGAWDMICAACRGL